jgi:hypothetical protein
MSHSVESSFSYLAPTSSKVRFYFFLINIFLFNFQFDPNNPNKSENDINQTAGVLLPLSPLFDATVDNDYLAVQSLISKNYDINAKV